MISVQYASLVSRAIPRLTAPAGNRFITATLLAFGLFISPAFAQVSLPDVFSDHMVLQRRQPNRVWGKAAPGEKIVVTIDKQSLEATAAPDGAWQVTLAPMEAGAPLKLLAKGQTNEVSFDDVLVGEVWICSGQSNMRYALSGAYDADLELPAANHPEIRLINFPGVGAQIPVWTHDNTHWVVCTPQSARSFPAVGYFFARQIHDSLNVPVGIIDNAWAGSRAEAWIPRKYYDGHENLLPLVARFDGFAKELTDLEAKGQLTAADQTKARQLRTDVYGDDRPANAWNGIVASHAGYGIRGVLWYQGEGNTPRGYQYRELFPLLIESWRKEWGQGDFPFYWVQLPGNDPQKPDPADSKWAELREAQTMTLAKLPNTGQAVSIDLGEDGNLHPRSKRDIGLRLARIALARDYAIQMPYQSPTYHAMQIDAAKVTLTFDHANGRLHTLNGDPIRGFAIAGADKKFVWAEATINRDGSITVSSNKVPTPLAVRYAWADNPDCNVFDNARLPLTPFRTDDWPGATVGVLVN